MHYALEPFMQDESGASPDEPDRSREEENAESPSSPDQFSGDRLSDGQSSVEPSSKGQPSSGEAGPDRPSRKEEEKRARKQREKEEEIMTAAESHVSGPAIALMITAGISLVVRLLFMGLQLIGLLLGEAESMQASSQAERIGQQIGFVFGIALFFLLPALDALVIFGAVQMKYLKSWGLSMTGAIIACIPCLSPICVFGIPFGIWAIVALSRDVVQEGFDLR